MSDGYYSRAELLRAVMHQGPKDGLFAKSTIAPTDAILRAMPSDQSAQDITKTEQYKERDINNNWDPHPKQWPINDPAHAERLYCVNLPPLMENTTKIAPSGDPGAILKTISSDQGWMPSKEPPGLPANLRPLLFPPSVGGLVVLPQR